MNKMETQQLPSSGSPALPCSLAKRRGSVAMEFRPSERPAKPKLYAVSKTMARALETGRWSNPPYVRILDEIIYPALGEEWVGGGCTWSRLPNVPAMASADAKPPTTPENDR